MTDVPTKSLRLADLDPRTVGRAAARQVLEHLGRLAFKLSPGVTVDVYAPRPRENQLPAHGAVVNQDLDATDVACTVAALAEYAQRGCSEAAPVWDWTSDEMAADAIAETVAMLATDALGTEGGLAEVLLGHADRDADPLRLVLTAAWGRVQLARGEPLAAPQLAALAGLSPSRVRALRQAGEIPGWTGEGTGRGATPCPAHVARAWLEARGVLKAQ